MMSLRALGNLGTTSKAAKAASQYYENSSDYYLKDAPQAETEGQWIGEGTKRLGLKNPSREELQLAFAGFIAGQEVQNAGREDRQMGWDLTFSAPKSVSIAWAAATEHRSEIEKAHFMAAVEAHSYLESQTATRRGSGGIRRERAYLASALFTHYTSRAGDPQLHSHVVVPNFCVRGDGTVGTIESKQFYEMKLTAGALYQAELSYRMKELGYRIEQGSPGTFRLADVQRKLEELYSKRDSEIDRVSKEVGMRSYAGTRRVVLSTRMPKQDTDLVERKATWEQEAQEAGLSFEVVRMREPVPAVTNPDEIKKETFRKMTEQNSTFQEKDFIREAARASYGSLNAQEIRAMTEKAKYQNDLLYLSQDKYGKNIYTTKEMMEIEHQMIGSVRSLTARKGDSVNPSPGLLKYPHLNEEQKAAVRSAAGESGLVVIQGRAGVGKTTTLSAIRENYEQSGWKVQGIAIAGRAAETLQKETGIESKTFAAWSHENQGNQKNNTDSKTLLVVDEAGMVGSRGMKEILEKAEASGAKVILVGDERQLQPIDAGGALHAVDQEVLRVKPEASGQIATIMRQKEGWMREVVSLAASGKAKEALQGLNDHGKMSFYKSGSQAKETLVENYLKREGSDAIILTHHKSDACEINEALRGKLQEQGSVGKDSCRIHNGQREIALASGDRVMFTQNDYDQGVRNGQRGTITHLEENKMSLRMDGGEEKVIDLSQYNHVDYGWAMTTHKAQGATVDMAYLYGHSKEWMASQQATYVQISRAREETLVYVVQGEKSIERPLEIDAEKNPLDPETQKEVLKEMSQTWGRDASKGTTRDYVVIDQKRTQGKNLEQELRY